MIVARTVADVREALAPLRAAGGIGLVPTMGAFHAGHLSLLRAARAECSTVTVSLFVNPAQFRPDEDFERYPRDEERDLRLADESGVDVVFAPPVEEIYPPGFQTWVEVTELGQILEGRFRPGHFRAVATVCLKLFAIVRPQRAYFGQKDAQQVEVVRRLIRDLELEIELRVVPTVRDEDGLALSSRNAYLTPAERRAALALPRALARGAAVYVSGSDPVRETTVMLDGLEVDYVDVAPFDPPALVAAVRVGRTRLIDNVPLKGETR